MVVLSAAILRPTHKKGGGGDVERVTFAFASQSTVVNFMCENSGTVTEFEVGWNYVLVASPWLYCNDITVDFSGVAAYEGLISLMFVCARVCVRLCQHS